MNLYQKLWKALEENEIDELGLLPVIPESNELPLDSQVYYPIVVIESKLGISIHDLAILLKQAHEYYITLCKQDEKELEQVTRIMILLKPDNYTAMNRRKELIQSGYINIKEELKLIELIFTIPKHSKSSIAWYHRQWIFTEFKNEVMVDLKKEFKLCEMTSSLYPRNYYSWTYRNWIISTFCLNELNILQREYKETCDWIVKNISDYSGFQYLQQLIELLKFDHIKQELHMNWLNNLIIKYPGNESLWCHRRFCSSIFINSDHYCTLQHQFIHDVIHDKFSNQALSNDFVMQKEYALRFGLFHTLKEKKRNYKQNDDDDIKLYSSVAPSPDFLDRQELYISNETDGI